MRSRILTVVSVLAVAAAGLTVSSAAFAQSATTTDDIICKMSNTCGQAAAPAGEKQAVGDEKMFSLAKTHAAPAAPAPAQSTQATGPEKMFSLQKRAEATPAPVVAAKGKKTKHTVAPAASSSNSELTMQVNFAMGSADLTDGAKVELSKYVAAMQSPQLSAMTFVIEGHTDATGSHAANLDLSQRRAQSVVDYLTTSGVASTRLKAQGFGPDKPLAGVAKKSAAQRRVELVRAS